MSISDKFQKWGLAYSGCDGGDIGSPSCPSTWVCGIEWGGGHTPDDLASYMDEDLSNPPSLYEDWSDNLAFRYNWQAMKLLSAINNRSVSEYKTFAKEVQPFIAGKSGYFKMNLYPIAFKDTVHSRWHDQFSSITGFENKSDYLAWCVENRFPQMRRWAEQSKPKLILCLGKSYMADFINAFLDAESVLNHEVIDDRDLFWSRNLQKSLVVIAPFLLNRNGLVRNESIQKFGSRISELLTNQSTPTQQSCAGV